MLAHWFTLIIGREFIIYFPTFVTVTDSFILFQMWVRIWFRTRHSTARGGSGCSHWGSSRSRGRWEVGGRGVGQVIWVHVHRLRHRKVGEVSRDFVGLRVRPLLFWGSMGSQLSQLQHCLSWSGSWFSYRGCVGALLRLQWFVWRSHTTMPSLRRGRQSGGIGVWYHGWLLRFCPFDSHVKHCDWQLLHQVRSNCASGAPGPGVAGPEAQ